jgi:hypothetical protein
LRGGGPASEAAGLISEVGLHSEVGAEPPPSPLTLSPDYILRDLQLKLKSLKVPLRVKGACTQSISRYRQINGF